MRVKKTGGWEITRFNQHSPVVVPVYWLRLTASVLGVVEKQLDDPNDCIHAWIGPAFSPVDCVEKRL